MSVSLGAQRVARRNWREQHDQHDPHAEQTGDLSADRAAARR